jgi:hypothetical protein
MTRFSRFPAFAMIKTRAIIIASICLIIMLCVSIASVNAESVCGALGVYPDGSTVCIPYDPPVCWFWQGCVPTWVFTDPETGIRFYTCLCRA